jgi:hypothetical protein
MIKTDIGYYKVGDKLYSNKFDAVMSAQLTNSPVTWNFFDEQLSKVDWTIEPELSLDTLYKMRAQQIRDQYDYIIVFCSGGSDSNNVIRTFLNNNIHVDEVMALAPMSGLNNWEFNKNNTNEDNTISETRFALFPLLTEIANKNSNIKITVNDFFEDILKYKDEYWAYQACGNIVTVLTSHFTNVTKYKHINDMLQSGKRVGLVYGTDKPSIKITQDGDMKFILGDAGINYLNMPEDRQHPNLDRVLFYWTPDLPEIMVKQAHVVAKAVHLPENLRVHAVLASGNSRLDLVSVSSFQDTIDYRIRNNLEPPDKTEIFRRCLQHSMTTESLLNPISSKTLYQRRIVPFIYPTTHTVGLYQCLKVNADAGFFTKDQAWLHKLHGNTRYSQMVISATTQLYKSISPKYLNAAGTGFINYFKSYTFGKTNRI